MLPVACHTAVAWAKTQRSARQYFEIDADPAGTYMGHVTGHEYVAGTGHQWQIKFPAIGNNQEHVCVYDENEMQNYCVAGDSDGVITATNIERLTDKIEDDYLSLDDFQLFVPKKSVSFTIACDSAGIPKTDRRLYFNLLRDRKPSNGWLNAILPVFPVVTVCRFWIESGDNPHQVLNERQI